MTIQFAGVGRLRLEESRLPNIVERSGSNLLHPDALQVPQSFLPPERPLMTQLMKFSLCVAVVASCYAFTENAQAQVAAGNNNVNAPFIGPYGGYGILGVIQSPLTIAEPPYFAKHPPVYYDKKIHYRSYGVSPFPIAVENPLSVRVYDPDCKPQKIINPHVDPVPAPPAPVEDKSEDKTSLRIMNPYFGNSQAVVAK